MWDLKGEQRKGSLSREKSEIESFALTEAAARWEWRCYSVRTVAMGEVGGGMDWKFGIGIGIGILGVG